MAGKAGQSHPDPLDQQLQGLRARKDMDPRVRAQKWKRDARALVVSGDQDDRDAGVGHPLERLERVEDELPAHAAAEQEIAAVDHQIHPPSQGRRQSALEVVEEVGSSAATLHSGSEGKIETEVCVREQQHP